MPPRPPAPLPIATVAVGLLWLTSGCVPASERASGRVFPLPRHSPHDGLAVVNRPGGEGLHLYLDTDTSSPGDCAPRWHPEAARLRGGDGPNPTSGGRVAAEEFFAALGRGRVRQALRREMEALCRARAPQRSFVWREPPRRAAEVRLEPLPLLEEEHLLSHPTAVRRAEKQQLGLPLSPEDRVDTPLPRPPGGP